MANARDRIFSQENYVVVGVGDSHMWGEGAAGWEEALSPRAVSGEQRRLPKTIPSFLSLFESHITQTRKNIGATHVVNSGYGSTSTKKYIECFWSDRVMAHKPDLAIIEFAINDWLSDREVSVDEYRNNLKYMTSQIIESGGDVVLLTVSPILGEQYSEGHYYEDYISASREVALSESRIILADANLAMKEFLKQGKEQFNAKCLFHDNWHVSQVGQELYYRSIVEALGI